MIKKYNRIKWKYGDYIILTNIFLIPTIIILLAKLSTLM